MPGKVPEKEKDRERSLPRGLDKVPLRGGGGKGSPLGKGKKKVEEFYGKRRNGGQKKTLRRKSVRNGGKRGWSLQNSAVIAIWRA